jgi:hypothetical protein
MHQRKDPDKPDASEAGPDVPEVRLSSIKGAPGVGIGEARLFLYVERKGDRWRFKLVEPYEGGSWLTSWATLDDPEQLRTSPHAKPIRDELTLESPEAWRKVLDKVIAVVQDNPEKWLLEPAEEEAEPAGASAEVSPGSSPGPSVGEGLSEAEVKRMAEDLLRDPRLLYRVGQDMGRSIIGEEENRLLMWLLHLTCQDPGDYTFQTVLGESAVGKTTLVRETLRYVPRKWWRRVGRISRTALEYLRDKDFKLLWIQEARGGEEAAPSIRLSSADDGGLEVWVTEKDPETGRFATTEIRLPGRSVVTTTTQVSINPQDATRSWLLSADASPEQTQRIVEYKLRRASEPPELLEALGRAPKDLAPVIQEAVSMLDYKARVVVAYADEFRTLLSSQVVRTRRDVDKMLGLIRIIARVHQHQRPVIDVGGSRFIYATAADALMAFELAEEPLQETLTGLESRLMEVYRAVQKLKTATNRTVAAELRKGQEYARRSLQVLVDMGRVDVDETQKTHVYTVRADMLPNVLPDLQRTLQAPALQKKVESALSMISSQPLTDREVKCLSPISQETGYFSPITGEWRELGGVRHMPLHPPEDERLRGDQQPAPAEGKAADSTSQEAQEQAPETSLQEKHPNLQEALHGFLDAEGGVTTISRLEAHLEQRGFGLDGLNKELHRLQYRGCILMTGTTISLGLEWRKPSGQEKPSSEGGTGEEVKPGAEAEAEAEKRADSAAVEKPTPSLFEAVMGYWAGVGKDEDAAADLRFFAQHLKEHGFSNPYGIITEVLSPEWKEREDWRLELVGAPLKPLGEDGECGICGDRAPLYADVENRWKVCLRCRLGKQDAEPGVPWRFRVVTR